jgi:2,3-dihydroxybenzoate-AMP ligase
MTRTLEPRLSGAVAFPAEAASRYRGLGLWAGQTVGEWFAERAARFAPRCALVDGEERFTYEQLSLRVDQVARGLLASGIGELDRVVLQLPNGVELVQSLLGLIRVGAVPVLALPGHRKLELEAFCRRSQAVALIVPARHAGTDFLPIAEAVRGACPSLRSIWVSGLLKSRPPYRALRELLELGQARTVLPVAGHDAADVALLQLSGGSTGIPKLIPRTHDDYLYSVRESAELCALHEESRFLALLPMTHNFTLSSPGMLGIFQVGGTVVSAHSALPELAFELFEKERITLVATVPSLARALLDAKSRCLPGRLLSELLLQVGGAKLDAELARSVQEGLGCRLQQVFGMAEGLVNYTRLFDPETVVMQTQGRPLSVHDEVRIVDPEDPENAPLPDGEIGELQTRGPYTIQGYFDDRANDSRHFTSDGFYRTGDLVRRTAEGNLVVEGRLGDRILRAGEKIAPEEIEAHLRAHPNVADAAVVGVADEHLGQRSHAFVTLAKGRDAPSLAELRRFLRERGLAEFKLPDAVHVIERLPRTKLGKTDKQALRASAIRN